MSDTPASAEVLINFYGRDKSLACVCGSAPSVSYYSWPRGEMKKIKPKRLRLRFSLSPFPPPLSITLSSPPSLSHTLSRAETMFQSRSGKTRLPSTAAVVVVVVRQVAVMDTVDFHPTAAPSCINFHKSIFFRTKTLKGVLYNSMRIHYTHTIFFNSHMNALIASRGYCVYFVVLI